jgi:transcriptional regulator with XRE-family HTH domain
VLFHHCGVRTIHTRLHQELTKLLTEERVAANLNQRDLAKRLGLYQSWVAKIEGGQRRVDVVELFALADAIGFDLVKLVKRLREQHPPQGAKRKVSRGTW